MRLNGAPRRHSVGRGAGLPFDIAVGIELFEVGPKVVDFLIVLDASESHFRARDFSLGILDVFLEGRRFAVKRIELEARPLSQWLHAGLKRAGFDTLLLETRHVKAASSVMMVKTDRKNARSHSRAPHR